MQPTFYFDIIFSTINFLFTGKSPFHFSIHGIDTLFITQFAWHTNSHSYIVTWTPPANLAATLSANSFIIYLPRKAASSWRPHRHTNRYNHGAGLTFWPFGAPQPRHLTGYSRAVGSGAPSRGGGGVGSKPGHYRISDDPLEIPNLCARIILRLCRQRLSAGTACTAPQYTGQNHTIEFQNISDLKLSLS